MEQITLAPFENVFFQALAMAWVLLIIVAPFLLGILCFQAYLAYKQNKFIQSQKSTLLEITLPRELLKSPLAMELFLTSLYQTKGEGTWISKYIDGKVRPWFSLEIVSTAGNVHFYIWTWEFWKRVIESQLYAQFPDIEVKTVEDYASKVHYKAGGDIDLFSCNFILEKADHYPIKTYLDYKLDKDPDEELKIDPMTPLLEYMGSLGAGEEAWVQIIIRSHKKERAKPGRGFFSKDTVDYTYAAAEEVKKIKTKDKQKVGVGEISIEGSSVSKGDKDIIEAIERNTSKLSFDTGIRVMYLAKQGFFNEVNISGLTGSFRQYGSSNLNSFKGDHATSFDYPWQDWRGKKLVKLKEHALHTYQSRSYFHVPDKGHFFTLSTEELATIYHFPGSVAKTPTLGRMEAKRSEPPANLPI